MPEPGPAAPAVEFQDIRKEYRTGWLRRGILTAVDGVSFRIETGTVFGLLGPNRAGKTTLAKILLSLTQPTSGRVSRFGRPVSDRRTLARVGFMHERQAFPRYWDATGLLSYYGALTLMSETTVRSRIPALLEQVQLADRSREPISQFSKGMVQRLALAQALLNDPDLLVLDEPAEGLDLPGRQLLRKVIAERREHGKTVLLISHATAEVEAVCDHVAVLRDGCLVHSGPLATLCASANGHPPRSLELALGELYKAAKS